MKTGISTDEFGEVVKAQLKEVQSHPKGFVENPKKFPTILKNMGK